VIRTGKDKTTIRSSLKKQELWLFSLLLTIYLLTYSGVIHAVDELSALAVTDSLVTGTGWSTRQMEWDQLRTPPQNIAGVEGDLYSKKSLGPSLLALPFYALGKQFETLGAIQVALLANAFLTAAAGVLFLRAGRLLALGDRTAMLGALAFGLATPMFPYARTLFSEPLAAFGLLMALYGALGERRNCGTALQPGPVLWAGVGISLLVLAKFSNVVAAPVFGLYLLAVWLVEPQDTTAAIRWQRALLFGASAAVGLLLTLGYNYLRFHTFFGFPLEPSEQFNTPLVTGITGQLFSAGKGLLWYMPMAILALPALGWWRRERRWWDAALAFFSAATLIILYALWYDWPGGRAWGPRMVIVAVPALALLALPALRWVGSRRWRGVVVAGVVLLSLAVQLPGVLVNFERQEGLDMQAGVPFAQLLWSLPHSPLITYWGKLLGPTRDPLWLQPYFSTLPLWHRGGVVLVAAATITALILASRSTQRTAMRRWLPAALVTLPLLLAMLMAATAFGDPRTEDTGAVREETAALLAAVRELQRPGDVVLLDTAAGSDAPGRTALWLNRAPAIPLIGWARRAQMDAASAARLGQWLDGYRRVWLNLQNTAENDPGSTTERWLAAHGFVGEQRWFGSQRLVEVRLADPSTPVMLLPELRFGDAQTDPATALPATTVGPISVQWQPDAALAAITWPAAIDPDLRYSLQVLDAAGTLFAQRDGAPASAAPHTSRVSVPWPAQDGYRLILKLYRASDGAVLTTTGHAWAELGP